MRAVVYTRISLDRFGDQSAVTRQREDALKLIELRGWELVEEYQDNDVSAAEKRNRPGFNDMLVKINTGTVDAVVAWSFDRLARNRTDELRLIEACQENSVTLALVRGSDIDMSTPAGRMVADIMATTARHEIEVKSDRQKRANLQRAKQGRPHISQRPFGYELNAIDIVKHEADMLSWGYSQIIAGASLRAVARRWNTEGAYTTPGNKWTGQTVRDTLLNPRYMGYRYYRGERIAKAVWDPIVSEDIFEAAKAILEDPKRSTAQDRTVKYLLTNIAECGKCDDGAKVTTARTQQNKRQYQCSALKHVTRKAQPIDDLVEAVILERLSRPDANQLLPSNEPAVDLSELRSESNAQRARISEAANMFADGTIKASQLRTITAKCEQRIEDLEQQIAATVTESPLTGLIGVDDVEAVWNDLDISLKREVVRTLFARIVVEPVKRGSRIFEPSSVRIEWKGSGNE